MSAEEWNAPVRIFPLDGVVFFPHSLLPLHIFEPRYRQMTHDALAADRRIAMVLPREPRAPEPVPVHPVACVGVIHNEQRLPDGRFNFLLRGECRVALKEEIGVDEPGEAADRLYRKFNVVRLEDVQTPSLQVRRLVQRAEILRMLSQMAPRNSEPFLKFFESLQQRCPPGVFSDIVSFASPLPLPAKQHLLATCDVDLRLELLADALREISKQPPPEPPLYPPVFSEN